MRSDPSRLAHGLASTHVGGPSIRRHFIASSSIRISHNIALFIYRYSDLAMVWFRSDAYVMGYECFKTETTRQVNNIYRFSNKSNFMNDSQKNHLFSSTRDKSYLEIL